MNEIPTTNITLAKTDVPLHLCYPSANARNIDRSAVNAIVESIKEIGLLQAITVRRSQRSRAGQMADVFEVIAGLHRIHALRHLGHETIPAIVLEADDLHAELMLIDENLCRNDLSPAERSSAQARRKKIYQKIHPETKAGGNRKSNGQPGQLIEKTPRYDRSAAASTGSSERTVRREVTRGETLGSETLAKIARTSLDNGDELDALAKLSPADRDSIVARAVNGERVSAKTMAKQTVRSNIEISLGAKQRSLPAEKFGVILADPPWRPKVYSRETGLDRSPDNHYRTLELDEIKALAIPTIAADDCVLFLWTTTQFLMAAGEVVTAWGFEYKSHFVWAKNKVGTGYWNRNKHEILLVATRGAIPAPAPGTQSDSLIEADVGEHSRKPDQFYALIEAHFPSLPKIELYARAVRSGWKRWGNEAPTDDATSVLLTVNPIAPDPRPATAAFDIAELVRPSVSMPFDADRDLPSFLRRKVEATQ